MYKGIISNEPTIENSLKIELDLRANRLCSYPVEELMEQYGVLTDPRYKSLEQAMWFALENVRNHGSGLCSLFVGAGAKGSLVVKITDYKGGFDPLEIQYHRPGGGKGLREYRKSKAKVGHSNDGKSTYLISPNKNSFYCILYKVLNQG